MSVVESLVNVVLLSVKLCGLYEVYSELVCMHSKIKLRYVLAAMCVG